MNKVKLERFIQKYNLGGNVSSVKWKVKGNQLSTDFVSDDRTLLGSVLLSNFDFDSCEIGINDTNQLNKLLGVLGDDIDMSLTSFSDKPVSLNVKNGSVSFNYPLADLSVIGETPKLKNIPDFDTEIKIDDKFINTFIKGKNALSDTELFSIVSSGSGLNIVIGYSSTNTNRINIPVDCDENNIKGTVTFNANLFKDILVSNKECTSATLHISNDGLAKINFKIDDYDSTYYLVAIQGNN
tara:strand:+ start:593 stop:1312 length:720 start_codon:yes stop_codon:yes gene_type:complete